MTGVEGYVESAASGLMAGINAARFAKGQDCVTAPKETAIGSMSNYITTTDARHFQPMNVNFGLLPPLQTRLRNKKEKNEKLAERALASLQQFKVEGLGIRL